LEFCCAEGLAAGFADEVGAANSLCTQVAQDLAFVHFDHRDALESF